MIDNYGCLMVYINIPKWNEILKFIDESEIIDDGLEMNPHITILYGINIDDKSKKNNIKKLLELLNIKKFPINITGISYFDNSEYDVLKFDIESNICNDLNSIVKTVFEHTNDYDEYIPHITIAYMMKGTSKKYKLTFDTPITIYPDKFVYTEGYPDVNGQITYPIK